jgi:hypothetical protein
MQEEHKVWLDANFPGQLAWQPAAGMVEEAGELLRAVLKLDQSRAYGPEPRHANTDWYAEMEDAIGDCAVFTCSLCNTMGWNYSAMVQSAVYPADGAPVLDLACRLVKAGADAAMVRNPAQHVLLYLSLLKAVAAALSVDFERAVAATWAEVKRRDRKQAKRRIVCLCGSCRFKQQFYEANLRETAAGRIVLSVGWFSGSSGTRDPTPEEKLELDELHKCKVDMSDEVLVIDVGRYIGDSTRSEIQHALRANKPVRYWSQENGA